MAKPRRRQPPVPTPRIFRLFEPSQPTGHNVRMKMEKKSKKQLMAFYIWFGLFLLSTALILQTVHNELPEPYLDEVFHVPQTQHFCNGSFDKWDPKITTLPGTYVLVTLCAKIAEQVGKVINTDLVNPFYPCSTYNLRLFNSLVGVQNFHLIKQILEIYMQGESNWKIMMSTVNISMFPVLFFFNFLFYTDVTSTMWVLLMHWLFLRRLFMLSAWSGAMAVITRQTNIIWVAWHGLLLGLKYLEKAVTALEVKEYRPNRDKIEAANHKSVPGVTIRKFQIIAREFLIHVQQDLSSLAGYVLVCVHFVVFVIWNGGIVVGDKTAHVASLNFPQLGYFTIVFGFFSAPFLFTRLHLTVDCIFRRKWCVLLAVVGFTVAVYLNTVAHPYLLADNRHYPFYLWKNIFQAISWARYAFILYYVLIWAFIFENVRNTKYNYYALALFICAILQLVPQLLLEFRYFIPLYLMARMSIPKPTWLELICEFIIAVCVNAVTFRLFLLRPFHWPNSEDVQRFMW